jgi:hypothetical protein
MQINGVKLKIKQCTIGAIGDGVWLVDDTGEASVSSASSLSASDADRLSGVAVPERDRSDVMGEGHRLPCAPVRAAEAATIDTRVVVGACCGGLWACVCDAFTLSTHEAPCTPDGGNGGALMSKSEAGSASSNSTETRLSNLGSFASPASSDDNMAFQAQITTWICFFAACRTWQQRVKYNT